MNLADYKTYTRELRRRGYDPDLVDVFAEYLLKRNGHLRPALVAFRDAVDEAAAAGVDEEALSPMRGIVTRAEHWLSVPGEQVRHNDKKHPSEIGKPAARELFTIQARQDAVARAPIGHNPSNKNQARAKRGGRA